MSETIEVSTVPARLQHWAQQQPKSEAFVFLGIEGQRTVLTSKDIFDRAVHFARQLKKLGLKPGDIVCSLLPCSTPNGFIAFFGIIVAGCVVFNGKLHLKDGTFLIQNLNQMKCKAFILSSKENEPCHKLMSQLLGFKDGHKVSSDVLVHVENVVYTKDDPEIGFSWMIDESQSHQSQGDLLTLDVDADAVILLSSGTTGMSKKIVISHRIFMNHCESYTMNSKSGLLSMYPLNWGPGLPIFYMQTGLKTVYMDQRFCKLEICEIPRTSLDFLYKEKCDVIMISFDVILLITSTFKNNAVPENWPETCVLLGRPLSKTYVEKLKGFFNTIYNMYGSSECYYISYKKITKSTEFEDFNTGIPIIGSEFIIRDEKNAVLPKCKIGNVYVKTKAMFTRYFGNEELTKAAFDDEGYFITSDMGYVNGNGDLIIFGRQKDVIARSEDYFHPVWIENVIRRCPAVKDVIVVKVPDEDFGNEICACVVLVSGSNFTAGMIEEFCKDSFVKDDYEHVTACPKYFLLLDKIPLNRNKKSDRLAVEKYAAKTHHYDNKGKCGVCGDAYNVTTPEHQPPGKYAQGIISRCYAPGTNWIDIKVEITANHLGHFQFKLCPNNDIGRAVTQSCLNTNILMIRDLNGVEHGEKYTIKSDMKDVYLKLRLPEGLSCSQCVLQWTYTTGNNWGCLSKWCGLGYGAQETFINCADIAVSNNCPTNPTAKPFDTELTDDEKEIYSRNCVPVGIWAIRYYDVIKRWCQVNCVDDACPPNYCNCS